MNRGYLILIGVLLISTQTWTQVFSRQVIGSISNGSYGQAVQLNQTVGQSEYTTISSDSAIFTQGFNQPAAGELLFVITSIIPVDCDGPEYIQVMIESVAGCGAPPYDVYWDNVLGDDLSPPLYEGSYNLTVWSAGGCFYSQDFVFTAADLTPDCPITDLKFYNTITPNGDDKNDVWFIDAIELDENQPNAVSIFNRWGQLVWEAENYDNSNVVWKGEHSNGELLPFGTYYYVVEVAEETKKGFIELIR